MTRRPQPPSQNLSQEQLTALARDGVICVRGILDADWTQRLGRALDDVAAAPSLIGRSISRLRQGLYHDMFVWRSSDAFRDLWYESPLAHYAALAMRSQRVNLFYEEVFYRWPGSSVHVPWHQGSTADPVRGEQMVNIWVTADPTTADSGGLEFLRGSHLWRRCPDIESDRDRYAHEIVSWDMQPGDALIFDRRVLQGSGTNRSLATARRAALFRFAGDDARYAPQPNTMPIFYRHGLRAGDPLSGPLFPQLLPYGLEAERRPRDEGRVRFDWGVALRSMATQRRVELRRLLRPSRLRRA